MKSYNHISTLFILVIILFCNTTSNAQFHGGAQWYNGPNNYIEWKFVPYVADVSGDGKADIVVWDYVSERAIVYRAKQESLGFEAASVWVDGSINYLGYQTFVTDVTGDGKADIVGWNHIKERAVVWKSKQEAWGFEKGAQWLDGPYDYRAYSIYMADVTGDGKADIIGWRSDIERAVVWRAKQNGWGFEKGAQWIDGPYNYKDYAIYIADVNGDGRADIVGWNASKERAVVWRAKQEAWGFEKGAQWVDGPHNYSAYQIFVTDVSGDGRADIVGWNASLERAVVWRAQQEAMAFHGGAQWVDGPHNYSSYTTYLSDVNGDGRADIVGWNASLERAVVWKARQESMAFDAGAQWIDGPHNYGAYRIFFSDVSGDGKADIVGWKGTDERAVIWRAK